MAAIVQFGSEPSSDSLVGSPSELPVEPLKEPVNEPPAKSITNPAADSTVKGPEPPARRCHTCHKPQSDCPRPLRLCGTCRRTRYCSHACQNADWSAHRAGCWATLSIPPYRVTKPSRRQRTRAPSPSSVSSASSAGSDAGRTGAARFLRRRQRGRRRHRRTASARRFRHDMADLRDGMWLDKLPRRDALCALCDAYRLRVEDEHGVGLDRGLHDDADPDADPLPALQDFLDNAENRTDSLPAWWDERARAECEDIALDEDLECCVWYAADEGQLEDAWGDRRIVEKLRLLGEIVEGIGVMALLLLDDVESTAL